MQAINANVPSFLLVADVPNDSTALVGLVGLELLKSNSSKRGGEDQSKVVARSARSSECHSCGLLSEKSLESLVLGE